MTCIHVDIYVHTNILRTTQHMVLSTVARIYSWYMRRSELCAVWHTLTANCDISRRWPNLFDFKILPPTPCTSRIVGAKGINLHKCWRQSSSINIGLVFTGKSTSLRVISIDLYLFFRVLQHDLWFRQLIYLKLTEWEPPPIGNERIDSRLFYTKEEKKGNEEHGSGL
jgi:hypothetical protein